MVKSVYDWFFFAEIAMRNFFCTLRLNYNGLCLVKQINFQTFFPAAAVNFQFSFVLANKHKVINLSPRRNPKKKGVNNFSVLTFLTTFGAFGG